MSNHTSVLELEIKPSHFNFEKNRMGGEAEIGVQEDPELTSSHRHTKYTLTCRVVSPEELRADRYNNFCTGQDRQTTQRWIGKIETQ